MPDAPFAPAQAADFANLADGATYTFVGGNGGNLPALTPGLITSKGNGTGYDFGVRHVF